MVMKRERGMICRAIGMEREREHEVKSHGEEPWPQGGERHVVKNYWHGEGERGMR